MKSIIHEVMELEISNGDIVPCLVSDGRIKDIPEGMHRYSCREGDVASFGSIQRHVTVDHMSDILTLVELDIPNFGLYHIECNDWKLDNDNPDFAFFDYELMNVYLTPEEFKEQYTQ